MKNLAIRAALALALGYAGTASAGCGLTVTFDNDLNSDIKVLSVEAKPTGGTYSVVHSRDFEVRKGKKVVKAIETTIGCAAPHNLRVKYQKGSSTLYKTKGPLATAVDRSIRIEFDD